MSTPIPFWQPNTAYPAFSYIFDGVGNIQFTANGGVSGAVAPIWNSSILGSPPELSTIDGTVTWTFKGYGGRAFQLQRAQNSIGPYEEFLNDAVSYSRGSIDAGKFVLLDASGQLDSSMGGGGGGGGSTILLTAGQNILAFQVVYVGPDGNAYLASANNIVTLNVVGVAVTSASAGGTFIAQAMGAVNNSGFTFTAGERVYVGDGGALVQAIPGDAAYEFPIGTAENTTTLLVSLGLPIVLA